MNLRLLKDNVLVRIHEKDHTESGIFLPEIARDRHDYRTGTVVYAGNGYLYRGGNVVRLEVKAGDDVMLDFGGQWMTIDGVLLAVVREKNILAVLEKEGM